MKCSSYKKPLNKQKYNMKKHNDLGDTPIAQADIDNGKLKLVKRKTNG